MYLETNERAERRLFAQELNRKYAGQPPQAVLHSLARSEFFGTIGLVSSFGAESAVLLHMVSQADPYLPVIFLDTGKHFDETIRYREMLTETLGLNNIQLVTPRRAILHAEDRDGTLHKTDPDLSCQIRKTQPMLQALRSMSCWITGRKRFQSSTRAELELFEAQDRWIKVNPICNWTAADVDAYFADHNLPRHPLQAAGYPSIGCAPCTRAVASGEDPRAGRWAGMDKTECGIHIENGLVIRGSPAETAADPLAEASKP